MASTPGKVSVVIPSYNYARYLSECVAAVELQSYSDWEIVIVDDGSTDDTSEVGPQVAARNPSRIRYIRQANQGVAAARNAAIECSSGEFIFPLDADDLIAPEALEEFVRVLVRRPDVGIAYSAMEIFGTPPGEPTKWIPGECSEAVLPFRNYIPVSSMWRRTQWEQGVRYRPLIFEDWELWLQIVSKGFKTQYIPLPLLKYRCHPLGRDRRNRFFYMQALAEQSQLNPSVYPPGIKPIADSILAFGKESQSKPTIVVVPAPESGEFRGEVGPCTHIIEEFLSRHHLVVTMGVFPENLERPPGLLRLSFSSEQLAEQLIYQISRIGPDVIVISELPSGVTAQLQLVENVKAVIHLGAENDPLASASISGTNFDGYSNNRTKERIKDVKQLADEILILTEASSLERRKIAEVRSKKLQKLSQPSLQWLNYRNVAPPISVAIPVRNVGIERLERCVQSIRQCGGSEELPIIISDFGSSLDFKNALLEIANRYKLKLISTKTRAPWSRSRALNAAIRACETPWILMTDVDMIFSQELIPMWREYWHELGDKVMYLCQCVKLPPLKELPLPWNAERFQEISIRGRLFDTIGQGGCQIISVDWLNRVRGFNETYQVWGLEDNDLTFRAAIEKIYPLWMRPGRLLHQWHIKAAPSASRDINRAHYQAMLRNPQLVVNDSNWGTASAEEEREFDLLGPLEALSTPERQLVKELEAGIFSASTMAEQIELLLRWGEHSLANKEDENASESFEDVLTLDPNCVRALTGLAQTLMLRHAHDAASHYAALAHRIDPQNELAKKLLATTREFTAQV